MDPDSVKSRRDDQSAILPVIALPGKVIFPRVRQPLNVARAMGGIGDKICDKYESSYTIAESKRERNRKCRGPMTCIALAP